MNTSTTWMHIQTFMCRWCFTISRLHSNVMHIVIIACLFKTNIVTLCWNSTSIRLLVKYSIWNNFHLAYLPMWRMHSNVVYAHLILVADQPRLNSLAGRQFSYHLLWALYWIQSPAFFLGTMNFACIIW